MSVVSPSSVELPTGPDDKTLPVQIVTYLLPDSFDPADINVKNAARLTRVKKNGKNLDLIVQDPALEGVTHNAQVWLYSVPGNVFPYLRTIASMYSSLTILSDDPESAAEQWADFNSTISDDSPVRLPVLVDILSIIVNWYELNIDRLQTLIEERAAFEPSSEDLEMISSFFKPTYTGEEAQKLLYVYMVMQAHINIGATEFEKVLTTWMADLLDNKTVEEARRLTGAVNDLVRYDSQGNILMSPDGQPIPSVEAINIRRNYPSEMLKLLKTTGQPIPPGLEEEAAAAEAEAESLSSMTVSRPVSSSSMTVSRPASSSSMAGPSMAGPRPVSPSTEKGTSIGDLMSGRS